MDQHTDSRGEHRSVDHDPVPAVEAEMSVCAICRRAPGQHGHTGREAATHEFVPAPETVEAHKGHECSAWCVFQSWVSEIRGGAPNTDDLGLRSAFDAIAAEARSPLEERVRELEARDVNHLASLDAILNASEAENAKLREALGAVVGDYGLAGGYVTTYLVGGGNDHVGPCEATKEGNAG